jgi:hypothetical protein
VQDIDLAESVDFGGSLSRLINLDLAAANATSCGARELPTQRRPFSKLDPNHTD